MSHLGAPEFDGPVKRGGDEEMREVNRSSGTVTAQPSHRTMMALEHLSYTRLTVTHTHMKMTVRLLLILQSFPQRLFQPFASTS